MYKIKMNQKFYLTYKPTCKGQSKKSVDNKQLLPVFLLPKENEKFVFC